MDSKLVQSIGLRVRVTVMIFNANTLTYGLFSQGTPVSSTNTTDRHNITEILLKVALNIITVTLTRKPMLCTSLR
jgi:hypothetical protein